MAWPGELEAITSIGRPRARNSASFGPASLAARPPPAAGFTMAMKRSMPCVCFPVHEHTLAINKGNLQRPFITAERRLRDPSPPGVLSRILLALSATHCAENLPRTARIREFV